MTALYSLGPSHYSRHLHRRRRMATALLTVAVLFLLVLVGWMAGGAV